MPPANSCQRTSSKPARAIARRQLRRLRKALDRRRQVPVRGAVATEQLAQQWHDAIEPEPVEAAQVTGRRDLQDDDATARAHHPRHLGDAAVQIADVADAEGDRRTVELVVGERQRERVGLDELDGLAPLRRLRAGTVQHVLREIDADRPPARGDPPRQREREVAGAGAHVERRLARRDVGGGGRGLAPAPIQAGGHHAIEQVVAWRDAVEHRLDLRRREAPRALLARRRTRSRAHLRGIRRSRHVPRPRPSAPSSPCGTPR